MSDAEKPRPRRDPRKDRLIQARVPRELEANIKEEARRRRMTVSQFIRNILEDTFFLVDDVVTNVDQLVSDSVGLARQVQRDARRVVASVRGDEEPQAEAPLDEDAPATRPADEPETTAAGGDSLDHVYAWNEVVLHREVRCSRCGGALVRGQRGFAGLTDAGGPRAWLCEDCVDAL